MPRCKELPIPAALLTLEFVLFLIQESHAAKDEQERLEFPVTPFPWLYNGQDPHGPPPILSATVALALAELRSLPHIRKQGLSPSPLPRTPKNSLHLLAVRETVR